MTLGCFLSSSVSSASKLAGNLESRMMVFKDEEVEISRASFVDVFVEKSILVARHKFLVRT